MLKLPPKKRTIHKCKLSDKTAEKVTKALTDRQKVVDEMRSLGGATAERGVLERRAKGLLARAFQATGEGKISSVSELLLSLLQQPDPRHPIDAIGADGTGPGAPVLVQG